MNFYSAFCKAFRSRPFEALGALYWRVTGRKVRARNRLRISLAQGPQAYLVWIQTVEQQEAIVANVSNVMLSWRRPTFSVIVYQTPSWTNATADALVRTMNSQIYLEWEVIVVRATNAATLDFDEAERFIVADTRANDVSDGLRIGTKLARGDYLLVLPDSALLPPTSLFRYAEALQNHPAVQLLFGDSDWIDARDKRYRPWFKPEWNDELALGQDYLSSALVISRDVSAQLMRSELSEGVVTPYALALALGAANPANIRHVPYIQCHLRRPGNLERADIRLSIVQAHLERMGTHALASIDRHEIVRVDWPLPKKLPLVSIIIPTRDKVSLLRACVESVLAQTSYCPFEILVVDNGSQQPSALTYLDELAQNPIIRVLRDPRPYNFSQLNNVAAAQARGDYLCLLNNDTEIIDSDWLTAMVRQATRRHVGAVGARLLYADGSIQHAGVVVGMGSAAGHAHRFLASEDAGYFGLAHSAHYVSAVTAACLVVAKEKFRAVGGLDEHHFAIAFNDVDFCLKLQAAGWRNVYTPSATLLHHESKSRGKDISPKHIDRYRQELCALQDRWGTADYSDPLHHQNLDRSSETYLIKL